MSRKDDGLHRALMASSAVIKALITIGGSFQRGDCLLIIGQGRRLRLQLQEYQVKKTAEL